jgi:hypothetical protein
MATKEYRIPGKCSAVLDAHCEDAMNSNPSLYLAWKNQSCFSVGKGYQIRIALTDNDAFDLAKHFEDYGEVLTMQIGDSDIQQEGRVLITTAKKMRNS